MAAQRSAGGDGRLLLRDTLDSTSAHGLIAGGAASAILRVLLSLAARCSRGHGQGEKCHAHAFTMHAVPASHAGLGGGPPPKTDLHRFVKWPKYVRLQRQKRVLSMRLKVPPVINQVCR